MKACFPTAGNSGLQLLCTVCISTLPFKKKVKELDTVHKLAAHWVQHHYCQRSSVGLMIQFPKLALSSRIQNKIQAVELLEIP